ncbi:MAG: SlyX family protein [Propionivibrio sp.]
MDDRLTELESRVALGEDLLEELNHTVFRQQQQIEMLQEQLRLVYRQLQAGADAQSTEPTEPYSLRDEIPPHY